jgi:hypothetical protein
VARTATAPASASRSQPSPRALPTPPPHWRATCTSKRSDAAVGTPTTPPPPTGRPGASPVGKRHFLRHECIKCIILPRQARDKRTVGKTQNKSGVSSGVSWVSYQPDAQYAAWKVRKRPFCAKLFVPKNTCKNRIVHQDRLGTNM